MVTSVLAKNNINQTIDDYSYDSANADAIQELDDSKAALEASLVLNGALAGLMVAGFVFSAFTLGKPLRQKESNEVSMENEVHND